MYSINKNITNTIIIKNSKFICKIYQVNSIDEAKNIITKLNEKYKDANHVCYSYIINDQEKAFDNGEPSGTAGTPILNVLKKNNLTNILAVVIRYFGGIKLGAGGLVRAYSNSVTEALKLTNIVELTEGYLIEIKFNYDQLKIINYILYNKEILEKKYDNLITYKFYLSKSELNFILELEKVVIHVSIKDKVLIEKNSF